MGNDTLAMSFFDQKTQWNDGGGNTNPRDIFKSSSRTAMKVTGFVLQVSQHVVATALIVQMNVYTK